MNSILAGLNAVPGVFGSCVFDPSDRCVAHLLPHPYEPILLNALVQDLRSALTVLAYLEGGEAWKDLFLQCDGGFLGFKSAGAFTLMVVAGPETNLSMLGVGATVAGKKLEQLQSPAAEPAPIAPAAVRGPAARREGLPKATQEALVVALARQIGPIARLLVEQAAARGAAEGGPGLRELVSALAQGVEDAARRREFLTEVETLVRGK